jgi:hypothetical protein
MSGKGGRLLEVVAYERVQMHYLETSTQGPQLQHHHVNEGNHSKVSTHQSTRLPLRFYFHHI